jgi:hypothetical protein
MLYLHVLDFFVILEEQFISITKKYTFPKPKRF